MNENKENNYVNEEIVEKGIQKKKRVFKIFLLFFGIIFVILFSSGITVYVVRQKPEIFGLSKGKTQIQAEIDALVTEVKKLIDLPTDEKPTIATVTDLEKLKNQPFFKNAKNDDKVLIYANSRKAILYRPSEKRIIEVGTLNVQQSPEATSSSQKEVKTGGK